jgi:transcriptional regulator with XRE-family HTH domain
MATSEQRTAAQIFGEYLQELRALNKLSLRAVEAATNNVVSNAYLSQLETGKIAKPSPHILLALSQAYGVPYEAVMQRAGYFPASQEISSGERQAKVATFLGDTLTTEEEDALLTYLRFLRTQKKKQK